VGVEPALHTHERCEQPDRSCAGDQQCARSPRSGSPADAIDLLPRFRQHARRLEQHAAELQRCIDAHYAIGLDREALRAESMQLLDAVLRVPSVSAHIPFAERAARARHRVGAAHDTDHEISLREARALRRAHHFA
jgi:hypothetical protein